MFIKQRKWQSAIFDRFTHYAQCSHMELSQIGTIIWHFQFRHFCCVYFFKFNSLELGLKHSFYFNAKVFSEYLFYKLLMSAMIFLFALNILIKHYLWKKCSKCQIKCICLSNTIDPNRQAPLDDYLSDIVRTCFGRF